MVGQLWQVLLSLGPLCGLKSFLDLLSVSTKATAPEFHMLVLFCDATTHLVTVLDDLEMYEQQRPFTLPDYSTMAAFLNSFTYKVQYSTVLSVSENIEACVTCYCTVVVLYM
ncbi:ubiquitin-protein ligase E3B-like [Homarus americanus]|uniref:ubiquitin-protein ligase E3B-like n=1 Tax=Homarus americanus TaxID=6706 RepID=UPI001C450229|nr:ubiquitin-protein ligase E3B-like [Homarus americanus]